ncbi:hypothetical protein DFJ74DRAFT_42610 [Hyaloraphidium curvatum]|nr:hypothetical protein DFJ74DRAFT_42610 [Hyaloraphidium curvatum]
MQVRTRFPFFRHLLTRVVQGLLHGFDGILDHLLNFVQGVPNDGRRRGSGRLVGSGHLQGCVAFRPAHVQVRARFPLLWNFLARVVQRFLHRIDCVLDDVLDFVDRIPNGRRRRCSGRFVGGRHLQRRIAFRSSNVQVRARFPLLWNFLARVVQRFLHRIDCVLNDVLDLVDRIPNGRRRRCSGRFVGGRHLQRRIAFRSSNVQVRSRLPLLWHLFARVVECFLHRIDRVFNSMLHFVDRIANDRRRRGS